MIRFRNFFYEDPISRPSFRVKSLTDRQIDKSCLLQRTRRILQKILDLSSKIIFRTVAHKRLTANTAFWPSVPVIACSMFILTTPNASQPNFATCSKVGQAWKCMSTIWGRLVSPKTWGPITAHFQVVLLWHRDLRANIIGAKRAIGKRTKILLLRRVTHAHSSTIWWTLAHKPLTLTACTGTAIRMQLSRVAISTCTSTCASISTWS